MRNLLRTTRRAAFALAIALSLTPACTGTIGGGDDDAVGAEEQHPNGLIGQTPLRRLTRVQYDNTVRDLLGISGQPASSFAPDEQVGAFHSNAVAPVTDLNIEQYMAAAESLAVQAASDLGALLPCDPVTDGEDDCANTFIDSFGERAYRRPLTDADREQFRSVYQVGKQTDFASGIRLIVQTALQSPYFLYHVEIPTDDGDSHDESELVRLSSYEQASRLSYFLWSSMPDRELLDAAASGKLDTADGIRAQAERMLGEDKARDTIASFHIQWLGLSDFDQLSKEPAVHPNFDDAMRDAMREETERFVDYVIRHGDGSLDSLLTASYSFPTGPLAELYGVTLGADPNEPVELDPNERAGLLTQASVLSQHAHGGQSSPVHRGVLVRENLFCLPLPTPPEDVNNTPPDPDPNLTTRQRFAAHTENPECASCHLLIDGIGFGFENYDAIGAFRATENGKAVDASGEVRGTADIDGTFNGVVELAKILSESQTVRECVTRQWFRFAFGRVESEDDSGQLAQLDEAFASSDYNVRELLLTIVTTDAFSYRRRLQMETTP